MADDSLLCHVAVPIDEGRTANGHSIADGKSDDTTPVNMSSRITNITRLLGCEGTHDSNTLC